MTTSNEHNNAPAAPQSEPTEEMLTAGLRECEPLGELIDWREGFGRSEMRAVWSAMLAATPAPAPAQGEPFGHFRVEPFGWTDCAATDDGAIALYEHPMTNPWRDAVIEQLESWHIYVPAIHDNSPRLAIKALVNMECKAALDPAVSSEAAALAAQGVQAHTPAVPQGLPAFDDLDDDVIDAACTAGSLLYRVDLMRAYECIRKALAATPTPAPAQEVTTPYHRDIWGISHAMADLYYDDWVLLVRAYQKLDASIARMQEQATAKPCNLCQGSGVLGPSQKCICQYGEQATAPAQDAVRPQNCGTSYCSCIECVCEHAQEVGLTDEEIEAIAKKHMSTVGDHWCNEEAIREIHAEDFARAIIAALRAKGQS